MIPQTSRAVGLSPRVRGNHVGAARLGGIVGSIPACAGEPSRQSAQPPTVRVYPRVCGGTVRAGRPAAGDGGLSPRVRGNRRGWSRRRGGAGSIPACAGEPPPISTSPRTRAVYPRVCGGTAGWDVVMESAMGLSPRVRGNPVVGLTFTARIGSIPACAGEPAQLAPHAADVGVYPRVCGGTRERPSARSPGNGLSPRVRGNPLWGFLIPPIQRSIPACAGEPPRSCCSASGRSVYPRVCGGTR